jgi:hypothetical protein
MDYSELKEGGIYQLAADVENPHPDRRFRRQPDKVTLWKKGTRFVARERVYENEYSGKKVRAIWFELEWIDHEFGSLYAIPVSQKHREDDPKADQAAVIMAQLECAVEDFKAFTVRLGIKDHSIWTVMERFCAKSVLSHQQIEDEYNAWLNEPDETDPE